MFSLGDIVYARRYHRASYTHTFGKIVKITKGGKYRVQQINQKHGERKESLTKEGALNCITYEVEPDTEDSEDCDMSFLINSAGFYSKDNLVFEKYTYKKLENYLDGLD